MRYLLHFSLILSAIPALLAQGTAKNGIPQGITPQPHQTDNALTAETRHVYQTLSINLVKAATEMPEDAYDFKPTGSTRTFGDLIRHIAMVQTALCGNMNGHPTKSANAGTSKDARIAELKASNAECQTAFDNLSVENANVMVHAPAGELTHLAALIYIITHASEEYGQLTMYLRLNHRTPPTTDEAAGGGAGKVGTH